MDMNDELERMWKEGVMGGWK